MKNAKEVLLDVRNKIETYLGQWEEGEPNWKTAVENMGMALDIIDEKIKEIEAEDKRSL